MTNAGWLAGGPSPFRAPGLSSAKCHWFPLPSELGVARRAKYLRGFTATSVSYGLKEGKGQLTSSCRESSWILSLRLFAGGNPRVQGERGLCQEVTGRAPGGICWPHWLCEGPVAGGAEHLLLLHISEIQMVSSVCQSQLWTDCFLEVLISRKPWTPRLLSS